MILHPKAAICHGESENKLFGIPLQRPAEITTATKSTTFTLGQLICDYDHAEMPLKTYGRIFINQLRLVSKSYSQPRRRSSSLHLLCLLSTTRPSAKGIKIPPCFSLNKIQ